METALAGLLTGLSLIVAIGAQNAYVLRQGLRRQSVGLVVLICALSDALLITLGTLGIGVIVTRVPVLLTVLTWAGVAYLLFFAFRSFRSALHPSSLEAEGEPVSRGKVVATTLALTYLNPHVYLDTVVMLGTVANQQPNRWLFAGGAALGSVLWFSALGFGAHRLHRYLGRPSVWRVVDIVIGVVMVLIAVQLALMGLRQ